MGHVEIIQFLFCQEKGYGVNFFFVKKKDMVSFLPIPEWKWLKKENISWQAYFDSLRGHVKINNSILFLKDAGNGISFTYAWRKIANTRNGSCPA